MPSDVTPAAIVLDLTRLVSRAGRVPLTGVDRVELAWLRHLLDKDTPAFGLVRSAPGRVVLGRNGMAALEARIAGTADWGSPDTLSRLHLRQSPERRRALSDMRRHALSGCALLGTGRGLVRALHRHAGPGLRYLNTGHAHLEPAVFAAVHAVPGARAAVLVHDTIPLDYPDFTRPGQDAAFAAKLAAVSAGADRVIYNSDATRSTAEAHLARIGRVPPGVVAHLGVTPPLPVPDALPERLRAQIDGRHYFVTLGTIEPRKNHALLLDIWEGLARELPADKVPALIIAGTRGWRNEAVFVRLDAAGRTSPCHVFEAPDLSDGAVAALLVGARALLFPSLAEGFGLPSAEAAALGVPVLCNDLAVTREILGHYPVYANARDAYSWRQGILALAQGGNLQQRSGAVVLPTWAGHFELALRAF